ncbi:MAG: DNA repair exonuclease [Bacillota bacterium]|nr:DNA repair exonuclease [Bacillota bacterium]MDW7683518.1 DNA repair exonuclease [Bacillota bacterium]
MRVLHLADLHLGWQPEFLHDKKEERARERDNLLTRAANFALDAKNEICAVIIAGDLFETHRPPKALVESVLGQLQRLDRAGIFLLTVPGNHDEITYHDSVYRSEGHRWPGVLADNPLPQEIARLELAGRTTAFYGLAYTGGVTRTSPPLADFPKGEAHRHIGILHGSLNWDAGDRSLPIASDAVSRSGYDCLALGHIHGHSVRHLGKTVACYAGATEAKGFNDPGCGVFTILNLNDGVRVETADAACRPCLTYDLELSEFDTLQEVAEAVKSWADPEAIVRVALKGQANFQADADALQEDYAHLFYHLQVESAGIYLDDSIIAGLSAEPTIRGYFVKKMKARLEAAKNEEEKEVLRRALFRGVAALQGGVKP